MQKYFKTIIDYRHRLFLQSKSPLLILLLAGFCHATEISSIATTAQKVTNTSKLVANFYVRTITLESDSDDARICLVPAIVVTDAARRYGFPITAWDTKVTDDLNTLDNFTYSGTFTNLCTHQVTGSATLLLSRSDASVSEAVPYDVPAGTRCSVNVETNPNIPDISAAQSVSAVQFTSEAVGSGNLTFKPDGHDNNGGLLKGENGKTLSYSVTSSTPSNGRWNTADAQWRGDLSEDYSVKLDDVPSSTPGGLYQGTMTTTISCE